MNGSLWSATRKAGTRAWILALSSLGACQVGTLEGVAAPTTGISDEMPHQDPQAANDVLVPPLDDTLDPIPATASTMTIVGRTLPLDAKDPFKHQFGRAGVAFGVRFSGSEISITLKKSGGDRDAPLGVTVDGHALATLNLSSGGAVAYKLAQGLAPGDHEVWWTSRSESPQQGSIQLLAVELSSDGKWLPPPTVPERAIEVIGASADNGFGIDAPMTKNCDGFVGMDPDLAWPKLTADAVGARIINSSLSQQSMVADIDGKTNGIVAPLRWPRADPLVANPLGAASTGVEAVFIDLTENDYNGLGGAGLGDPQLRQRWQTAALKFLAVLVSTYPSARFYFVINSSQSEAHRVQLRTLLPDTVAKARAQGMDNTAFYEFPYDPNAEINCWKHPNRAAHQKMAELATALLRTDLGW